MLGRKLGWRAALAGGLVATIPDLDVMVPFDDPIADFTYHRGASHSLLVLTVVSPLLAWVYAGAQAGESRLQAVVASLLACVIHAPLDRYGDNLRYPAVLADNGISVGTGSIFIIDPAYTCHCCSA